MIFMKLMQIKKRKDYSNWKNSQRLINRKKIILIKSKVAKKESKLYKILKNNMKSKP